MAERRLIIGTCRSGSTALLKAFAQHPNVHAVYQPIKTGMRLNENEAPDRSFFDGGCDKEGKDFTVAKETIGHRNLAECLYNIFPDDSSVQATSPVFLLRDPVQTFQSWSNLGWGSLERFLASYHHVLNLAEIAGEICGEVETVVSENLSVDPEGILRSICKRWGMEYVDQLVNWTQNLGSGNLIERRLYKGSEDGFDAAHHTKARESVTFVENRLDITLSADVINKITRSLSGRLNLIIE